MLERNEHSSVKARYLNFIDGYRKAIWKVLKCGAGEGWRRSVGPIM
jgi:hypothetical protein